jgi:hypothetical protein
MGYEQDVRSRAAAVRHDVEKKCSTILTDKAYGFQVGSRSCNISIASRTVQ